MEFENEIDQQIFEFLQKEPDGAHPSLIAEKLGKSIPTISTRCQIMEASGILRMKQVGMAKVYLIKKIEASENGE